MSSSRAIRALAAVVGLSLAPSATAGAQNQQQRQCASWSSSTLVDECVRTRVDSVARVLRNTTGRVLELLPDTARRAFLMTSARWAEYQVGECRTVGAEVPGVTVGERGYIECLALLASDRTSTLRTIYGLHMSVESRGGCVGYAPDTVDVTGVLERRVHAGPPNYRSITRGDSRETVYYMRLDTPLCVSRNLDETNVPTAGVRRLQLELDRDGVNRLRSRVGTRLTLRGTLAHAFTARHRAELLLTELVR